MARRQRRDNEKQRREAREKSLQDWTPRTDLGRKVVSGEISSIQQVIESGKKILEPEIIDFLIPDLQEEVLAVSSTQRMTASGRKMAMRVVLIVGNKNGVVGVGVGKAPETRDAIAEALKDGKKHLAFITLGCGSWECGCGTQHSLVMKVSGKNSSTEVVIKPAPRGVGLVAGEVAKKVLEAAGVKDAWVFTKGRTRNVLNMATATVSALESLNRLKPAPEKSG
ncbi:MAG: 30S ribosomal protein S5 [Candidatus Micrarchaeota archaeon]